MLPPGLPSLLGENVTIEWSYLERLGSNSPI